MISCQRKFASATIPSDICSSKIESRMLHTSDSLSELTAPIGVADVEEGPFRLAAFVNLHDETLSSQLCGDPRHVGPRYRPHNGLRPLRFFWRDGQLREKKTIVR